jgi:hypothetical protein
MSLSIRPVSPSPLTLEPIPPLAPLSREHEDQKKQSEAHKDDDANDKTIVSRTVIEAYPNGSPKIEKVTYADGSEENIEH